ncbi:MAG: XRE family transcriptional regulator [Alphaproteobacteria bacterium]|nr:MAG: XRE family transcriptional regulator [Alphaproteobacteria bacterium]
MEHYRSLDDVMNTLPDERKNAIEERAAQKIKAYKNLQELRMRTGLTQAKISEELNIPQGNVSRLEQSSDMLLSTLQKYVHAVGGSLHITVQFPDQPPVHLSGLSDLIDDQHRDM